MTPSKEKKKMVWFAKFPHIDCKFMVVPCYGETLEPMDTIKEYMLSDEPFTVRFERHLEGWHEKFPEL